MNFCFHACPKSLQQPEGINEADAGPRGEAKSTLVALILALDGRHRCEKFIVIAMDSIDSPSDAGSHQSGIEFNPRLKPTSRDVRSGSVWQAGTFVTASNVKIQVFGSGENARHGAWCIPPDLAILDDIENDEMVRNPDQRDKLEM